MARGQTPSQTVGPFFAYALTPAQYGYPMASIVTADLVADAVDARPIRIEGRVFDGEGAAVEDALIEIVQANEHGKFVDARRNVAFRGYGRCGTGTDPDARYAFNTIKPGAVDAVQAPHVEIIVFMRGLLSHVYTRMYFSDEHAANASDPVLAGIDAARRETLIGQRSDDSGQVIYRFDIHMQGERETVFFDL